MKGILFMKKFKCPLCNDVYVNIEGLCDHIEEEHYDELPKGFTPLRYLYYIRNNRMYGTCITCKNKTEWNESTGRYEAFCSVKCKDKYVKLMQNRMINKYGKTTLLKDPEHQKKMLANRKISGKYEWTDGTEKTYTGSYELDAAKFLDVFMNFDSSDVFMPSPHTYTYENEDHFYIPDIYIASLRLEIEIKDGGDNPNTHHKIQNVDKKKEKLKDEVVKSQKDVDYIKIENKEYAGFMNYLLQKKEELVST
jgi:hypothetical protein